MSSEYPHGTFVPPIVNEPRSKASQEALDEEIPTDEQLEAAGMLPPRLGRPKRLQGRYQRITLEIREDLLAKIDASGKSRREYIEALLEPGN